MTLRKTLKKAVRARASKTGESYTAARRQLLLARERRLATLPTPAATPAPPAASTPATARPKRDLSEAAVLNKTGHGFEHWFAVLDAFDATAKGHTAAARHLRVDHGVNGWHSQGITVEYERERGLRSANQACSGDFQVSVSRAVAAPVEAAARALEDPKRRAQWLRGADPGIVTALRAALDGPRAKRVTRRDAGLARVRIAWNGLPVEIRITASAKGATVVADNTKLSGPEQVEARRAAWRFALDGLKRHLAKAE